MSTNTFELVLTSSRRACTRSPADLNRVLAFLGFFTPIFVVMPSPSSLTCPIQLDPESFYLSFERVPVRVDDHSSIASSFVQWVMARRH